MKSYRSLSTLDCLIRQDRWQRRQRTRRLLRFRLRSLMLVLSALCLVATAAHFWGRPLLGLAMDRIGSAVSALPTTRASELVALPLLTGGLIGVVVFGVALRLGATRGYMLFTTLSFLGLLAVAIAVGLQTQPLSQTEMRHLGGDQILRLVLLVLGLVSPAGAFLGWLSAYSSQRHR